MAEFTQYINKLQAKIVKYSQKAKTSKRLALRIILWNFKYILKNLAKQKTSYTDKKIHIGVEALGGMGDLIIAAKYVCALEKYFGTDVIIDILCNNKDLCYKNVIFPKNSVYTKEDAPNYDLYISFIRFPVIESYIPNRLNKKVSAYIETVNQFHQKNLFISKNAFLGLAISMMRGRTRENQGDINNLLGMDKLDFKLESNLDIYSVLQKFGINTPNYITIQTGSGRCWENIKNETRQWPEEYYRRFVRLLKDKYPEVQIIQIGSKKQTPISGVDIDLRDQTDMEEAFSLLKHAKLHISQEGGMVHARHFLGGGTSVVLFGPTDERFYGYPENINLSRRICPFACEWIEDDWMRKCIKTGCCADCMQRLTPEFIMEFVKL